MSEPMFPTASEEAAPFAAPAEETGGSGGNRKALLAVGGVVAALVVGGAAFFLLTGSGSGGQDEAWAPTVAPKAAAPSASAAPSGGTTVVKVKPVAVVGHDPFAPLFAVQASQGSTTGTGITTTNGGSTSSGVTTGVTTGGTTGGSTTASSVTLSVAGIDPVKQTATISVDGKKYVTTVGTPFGSYYMMYSVFNDTCVGVLAGDSSIAVCTTKPVSVTP